MVCLLALLVAFTGLPQVAIADDELPTPGSVIGDRLIEGNGLLNVEHYDVSELPKTSDAAQWKNRSNYENKVLGTTEQPATYGYDNWTVSDATNIFLYKSQTWPPDQVPPNGDRTQKNAQKITGNFINPLNSKVYIYTKSDDGVDLTIGNENTAEYHTGIDIKTSPIPVNASTFEEMTMYYFNWGGEGSLSMYYNLSNSASGGTIVPEDWFSTDDAEVDVYPPEVVSFAVGTHSAEPVNYEITIPIPYHETNLTVTPTIITQASSTPNDPFIPDSEITTELYINGSFEPVQELQFSENETVYVKVSYGFGDHSIYAVNIVRTHPTITFDEGSFGTYAPSVTPSDLVVVATDGYIENESYVEPEPDVGYTFLGYESSQYVQLITDDNINSVQFTEDETIVAKYELAASVELIKEALENASVGTVTTAESVAVGNVLPDADQFDFGFMMNNSNVLEHLFDNQYVLTYPVDQYTNAEYHVTAVYSVERVDNTDEEVNIIVDPVDGLVTGIEPGVDKLVLTLEVGAPLALVENANPPSEITAEALVTVLYEPFDSELPEVTLTEGVQYAPETTPWVGESVDLFTGDYFINPNSIDLGFKVDAPITTEEGKTYITFPHALFTHHVYEVTGYEFVLTNGNPSGLLLDPDSGDVTALVAGEYDIEIRLNIGEPKMPQPGYPWPELDEVPAQLTDTVHVSVTNMPYDTQTVEIIMTEGDEYTPGTEVDAYEIHTGNVGTNPTSFDAGFMLSPDFAMTEEGFITFSNTKYPFNTYAATYIYEVVNDGDINVVVDPDNGLIQAAGEYEEGSDVVKVTMMIGEPIINGNPYQSPEFPDGPPESIEDEMTITVTHHNYLIEPREVIIIDTVENSYDESAVEVPSITLHLGDTLLSNQYDFGYQISPIGALKTNEAGNMYIEFSHGAYPHDEYPVLSVAYSIDPLLDGINSSVNSQTGLAEGYQAGQDKLLLTLVIGEYEGMEQAIANPDYGQVPDALYGEAIINVEYHPYQIVPRELQLVEGPENATEALTEVENVTLHIGDTTLSNEFDFGYQMLPIGALTEENGQMYITFTQDQYPMTKYPVESVAYSVDPLSDGMNIEIDESTGVVTGISEGNDQVILTLTIMNKMEPQAGMQPPSTMVATANVAVEYHSYPIVERELQLIEGVENATEEMPVVESVQLHTGSFNNPNYLRNFDFGYQMLPMGALVEDDGQLFITFTPDQYPLDQYPVESVVYSIDPLTDGTNVSINPTTGYVTPITPGNDQVVLTLTLNGDVALDEEGSPPSTMVATANVNVVNHSTQSVGISIDPGITILEYGDNADPDASSFQFEATVTGTGYRDVAWSIESNDYVTIDNNGVVSFKETPTEEVPDFSAIVTVQSLADRTKEATAEVLISFETNPLGGFLGPYISGYPDQSFRPEFSVTRAEAATMFSRVSKFNENTLGNNAYKDISEDAWYYPYVQDAFDKGMFGVDPLGLFRPDEAISRAEVAAVFYNYITNFEKDIVLNHEANVFNDMTQEHWAYKYINAIYNQGLVVGYPDGTYRPDDPMLRQEIVQIINKLLKRESRDNPTIGRYTDVSEDYWAFDEIDSASDFAKRTPQ